MLEMLPAGTVVACRWSPRRDFHSATRNGSSATRSNENCPRSCKQRPSSFVGNAQAPTVSPKASPRSSLSGRRNSRATGGSAFLQLASGVAPRPPMTLTLSPGPTTYRLKSSSGGVESLTRGASFPGELSALIPADPSGLGPRRLRLPRPRFLPWAPPGLFGAPDFTGPLGALIVRSRQSSGTAPGIVRVVVTYGDACAWRGWPEPGRLLVCCGLPDAGCAPTPAPWPWPWRGGPLRGPCGLPPCPGSWRWPPC